MIQALYPDPPPPEDGTNDTQTSEEASLNTAEQPSTPVQRLLSDKEDLEYPSPYPPPKRARAEPAEQDESQHSAASHIMETDTAVRWEAYHRTLDRLYDGDWDSLPLLSTTDHHSKTEQEL